MCLLLFSYDYHPVYRLVVAANRDEFLDRPTATAAFWDDYPEVLAGRDLKNGGTWMGVTRKGRFAALTNYREPEKMHEKAPSRGDLVRDFLISQQSSSEYIEHVSRNAQKYNGFNLIVGDETNLIWHSNRNVDPVTLKPGFYGVSNHLLNTPWPKVVDGLERFKSVINLEEDALFQALSEILMDRTIPPDKDLPDTGMGVEWERILGAKMIVSPSYGTRCSTVLLIDRKGRGRFHEQTLSHGKRSGEPVDFSW